MNNKEIKTLLIMLLIALVLFVGAMIIISISQENKIKELENKIFSPVVIERTDDDTIKDERTRELVQQAYESLDHDSWFDYAYKVDFGANDYGQLLIFVTFYYSKANDHKDYKTTLVNYYQAPNINNWEVVE